MKINVVARTDVGKERATNEDAFGFCPDLTVSDWSKTYTDGYIPLGSLGAVMVVADGMGGMEAGEVASSMAVRAVRESFVPGRLQSVIHSEALVVEFMKSVACEANDAIIRHTESFPDTIGMGTTLVLLWLLENKAYIVWCGDSRCYVFNAEKGLRSLTKDHSYVQELVDKGTLSVADAYNHPDSNVITRYLGDAESFDGPDALTYEVKENDIFLLCSDGLCGYCRDKEIEKTIYSHLWDMEECCHALVGCALRAGGYDNIAVVVASSVPDAENGISLSLKSKLRRMFKMW